MSRYPRPVFATVPLHIIQRGNNRNPCFFSRNDYRTYLEILGEASQRFPCAIHAYVLMPNHVHLLATPETDAAPSAMIKWLSQKYVQHINRKYGRYGTLWQGRYRSCLVGDALYFLVCQRYIELNPVRAGLSSHPADYDWSSYRTNAFGQRSSFLVPHQNYLQLADTSNERQTSYRHLFEEAIAATMIDQVRAATNSTMFFGSVGFAQRMAAILGRSADRERAGRRCD
jgi:putative transposase